MNYIAIISQPVVTAQWAMLYRTVQNMQMPSIAFHTGYLPVSCMESCTKLLAKYACLLGLHRQNRNGHP